MYQAGGAAWDLIRKIKEREAEWKKSYRDMGEWGYLTRF